MFKIGEKSVAYLNTPGREALSGMPSEEYFAQPEEKKKAFAPHLFHLLSGRHLQIVGLVPDDSEKGYVEQDYLGVDKTYYEPTDRGYEKHIRQFMEWLKAPAEDSERDQDAEIHKETKSAKDTKKSGPR